MQLVPILSTIILVITTITTLLALAAYVMYKVGERRGRSVASHAGSDRAPEEHVLIVGPHIQSTPAPAENWVVTA